ncbi:hypothetical protein CC1G_07398 [Coprinopsis cinerea okayama7|uniref:Uncharacterized protein n=1 Tax=Coprinopsis cinerea (strain Okayama-7 / 130 / ATCC MYA-4618 / FGSC 9003) TaxID=240176 RepID=A8N6M7_COPC7|nr:hypothetical protein CC1G_07398 [Coprinopsis cinerea okayama7\|eukprot:XP_001830483.1 hypothetical protein CC1G_07398 [Coprinopsis cinerea okayama7\
MTAIATTIQPDALRPTTSTIRRKPLITYKSPSGPNFGPFIQPFPRRSVSSPSSSSSTSSSSPTPPKQSVLSTNSHHLQYRPHPPNLYDPNLPLYHPNGRLALSLPPLNAANYGLPILQVETSPSASSSSISPAGPNAAESGVNSIQRSRSGRIIRAASNPLIQRADSAELSVPGISSIAAVAAREIKDKASCGSGAEAKEKASPKKRRFGGKRKRKSPEDADATYPAKRTRAPRGGAHSAAADDDHDGDSAMHGGNSGSDNDAFEAPIIRTTRSRTNAKRRDISETPSSDNNTTVPVTTSSSLPPTARIVEEVNSTQTEEQQTSSEPVQEPQPQESVAPPVVTDTKPDTNITDSTESPPVEKEEGELSDDS